MDKLYVLVTGNGTTSRANLEALLEDYFFKKNTEVVLVLSYSGLPSQGQIFAAQFAKDKSKDILVFAPNDSSLKDIPGSSFTTSKHPINEATVFIKGSGTAFILWNPSDSDCTQTLDQCNAMGIPAHDLTTGLVSLSSKDIVVAEAPVEEPVVASKMQVPLYPEDVLTEAQKTELAVKLMAAIEEAIHNALKKA
jgi:hypothetical protein